MKPLEAYRPDINDWVSLDVSFDTEVHNAALNLDCGDLISNLLNEEELFEVIRNKAFHKLNDFDLLMVIGSDLWGQLTEEERQASTNSFWTFCAKNRRVGDSVYYWYLKNPHAFHFLLKNSAKNFKNHAKYFNQCIRGQFSELIKELAWSDVSAEEFCKQRNLPLSGLIRLKEFKKSAAKVFWATPAIYRDQLLNRLLTSIRKEDQKKILLHILKERADNQEALALNKVHQNRFLELILIEELTNPNWRFKFWGLTDQLPLQDISSNIKTRDAYIFLRNGFPNISDKHHNGEIVYKRWLSTRFSLASGLHSYFQYCYLIVQTYYLEILDIEKGKSYVRQPTYSAAKNFIFLLKPNGQYVIIFLPSTTESNLIEGAIFGVIQGIEKIMNQLDMAEFNYLEVLRLSKWTEEVAFGQKWDDMLKDSLRKRDFIG
jgi:hypothetical protein